jgi:hypothetical protein
MDEDVCAMVKLKLVHRHRGPRKIRTLYHRRHGLQREYVSRPGLPPACAGAKEVRRDALLTNGIRAGVLLRRRVPVPGILATHRPGAIMDKSAPI